MRRARTGAEFRAGTELMLSRRRVMMSASRLYSGPTTRSRPASISFSTIGYGMVATPIRPAAPDVCLRWCSPSDAAAYPAAARSTPGARAVSATAMPRYFTRSPRTAAPALVDRMIRRGDVDAHHLVQFAGVDLRRRAKMHVRRDHDVGASLFQPLRGTRQHFGENRHGCWPSAPACPPAETAGSAVTALR